MKMNCTVDIDKIAEALFSVWVRISNWFDDGCAFEDLARKIVEAFDETTSMYIFKRFRQMTKEHDNIDCGE